MANNIQIVGSIISTTSVSRYSDADTQLISSKNIQENFGEPSDYIEYFTYDAGGNLLSSTYSYLNYQLPPNTSLNPGSSTAPNTTGDNTTNTVGVISNFTQTTASLYPIIQIDPVMDLQNTGYSSGEFNTVYNFFKNRLSNPIDKALFVKEISQDRTEVRLASTTLSDSEIESVANELINEINNTEYYVDFLLNFGNNQQFVAINVALNTVASGYEILFKLYQPLPTFIQLKQSLWVVEEKVNPYEFDINLDKLILPPATPLLRGPNFDIPLANQNTISTQYNNYSGLISSLQSLQSNSYQKILNLITSQSVNINVDYTNYNNFAFFGSAYQRLNNFKSKLTQIESYNNAIGNFTALLPTTPSLQTEINQYSSSVNNIISQFDGYEHYLYFDSGSYTWPKSGSLKPYQLLSVTSSTSINWFTTQSMSASNYDVNNVTNLEYAVPAFVKDNTDNQPFLLFLNMTGQYFDNIWIYLKSVTDLNIANNNLYYGISKDLVYERLKSLGIKLYNSKAGEAVSSYYLGANTGSAIFDNNFTVTGSYLNNIPRKDLVAELYKRIYHNLPYLLKTKGTVNGLQALVTTFGITGSILNVKEFGGELKTELLAGYNTDKVRIFNNPIATGSYSGSYMLSNLVSLQSQPTTSSAFRDIDMNYVDISFSPETQIDTYISKSIASNNPSWSLDDYIGDPRQRYHTSYDDLDTQRTLYFQTGVAGFPGFTGSYMDYSGFINLIQYFDNSLFKMLGDFVPERTSLSTGVTINSPVLERNKFVVANPSSSSEIIPELGEITAPYISASYDHVYYSLTKTGSGVEYYTGQLSGSKVNVYGNFQQRNTNPYLGDFNVYNSQVQNPTQSISLTTFKPSDFNVLINNVSQSVPSRTRRKIEYVFGTTGSITYPAQLQDSYESLRTYQISRYEGSKTTSLLYNTYTSASGIYAGDNSYGLTAAIDLNTLKFAWVKSVGYSNLNFPDKTQVNINYLVDPSGSLTTLSSHNYNLFEVQNTFKSNSETIVSLSDLLSPSNQTSLNGNKMIWKGGYRYYPIIFRELNETLNFIFTSAVGSYTTRLGVKGYNNSSFEYNYVHNTIVVSPDQPATNGGSGYYYYINGSTATTLNLSMASEVIPTGSWRYDSGSYPGLNSTATGGNPYSRTGGSVYAFDLLNFNNTTSGYNTEPDPTVYEIDPITGTYVYKVPRTSTYNINGNVDFSFDGHDYPAGWSLTKVACIVEQTTTPNVPNSWTWVGNTNLSSISNPGASGGTAYDASSNTIFFDNDMHGLWSFNLPISLTNVSLTAGAYVRLRFYWIDIGNGWNAWNYMKFYLNASQASYFEIYDSTTVVTEYITSGSFGQTPAFFMLGSTNVLNDTLIFDSTATTFFNNSTYQPSSTSGAHYTPVTDLFSVQLGDLVRLGQFGNTGAIYYNVVAVNLTSGQYHIVLDTAVNVNNFDNKNFAFLRPKPDETSVILNFNKALGEVSQALLLPYDLDLAVKANVGNVVAKLNTTIGANNTATGGTF
jgi:hypothetical protein